MYMKNEINQIIYTPLLFVIFLQVGVVITTIQKGAVGTQACTEAINKIQGIVGDLETSAMFATAGALTTEGEAESLSESCHQIVETAKM